MAVSTQTVVVNVVVRGGGQANQVLNRLGVTGNRAGAGVSRLNQSFQRFIGTLGKALISMAGVLVAFNLFVTLPQAIARGLAALGGAAVKAGEELTKVILQTAGLLASFAQFGEDATRSFEHAITYAQRLQFMFAELAAKSLATAEDMQKGFQVFVARGGLQLAGGDIEKAAQTTAFLVNLVIALTGELQKERQIYTEIDAFLQGQARAGAVVARLLKAQVGDLQAYLKLHKEQGDLLEDLERRFGGITEASARLGETVSGMMTSITGSLKIVNQVAYRQGAFEGIRDILVGWRDTLISVTRELGQVDTATKDLTPTTYSILTAFTALNVAIIYVIESLKSLVQWLVGAEKESEILVSIANKVMNIAIVASALFQAPDAAKYGDYINDVGRAFEGLFEKYNRVRGIENEYARSAALRDLAEEYIAIGKAMGQYIQRMEDEKTLSIEAVKTLGALYARFEDAIDVFQRFGQTPGAMQQLRYALRALNEEIKAEIPTGFLDAFISGMDAMRERAPIEMARMMANIKEALAGAGLEDVLVELFGTQAGEDLEKLIARAQRELIRLQRELFDIRAEEDAVQKVVIAHLAKVKELELTYGAIPEYLVEMLRLEQMITDEKIKQIKFDAGRDLRESIESAIASTNKFSAAQVEIIHGIDEIVRKNRSLGSGTLNWLVHLKRVQVAEQLIADIMKDIESKELELIREKYGDIAEFEARRRILVMQAANMAGLEVTEKTRLLQVLFRQLSLEEEIIRTQREEDFSSDMLRLNRELERAKGIFDEIREVEAWRKDIEDELIQRYGEGSEELQQLLDIVQAIFFWREKTAELEAGMRRTRSLTSETGEIVASLREQLELLMLNKYGFDAMGKASFNAGDAIATLQERMRMNNEELARVHEDMEKHTDKSSQAYKSLAQQARMLASSNYFLARSYVSIIDALVELDFQIPTAVQSFQRMISVLEHLKDKSDAWGFAMQALGSLMADAMGSWIGGVESFGQALKKAFANIVKSFGDYVMGKALTAFAEAIWPPNPALIAKGLALTAVAGIIYGIASRLGAQGGRTSAPATGATEAARPEPYWIRNQDVAAQQSIQMVLTENTVVISRLNNEVSRLSREKGNVLVSREIRKNPQMVIQPVMSAASRSYSTQKNFGGALAGVNG